MKFRKVNWVQKLDVIRFFVDSAEKAEKLRNALSMTQSIKSVSEITVGDYTTLAAETAKELHTFVDFVNMA